jgi:hypothetical protein
MKRARTFRKGDRVRLSQQHWRRYEVRSDPARVGTILGVTPWHGVVQLRVLWDGRKTAQTLFSADLELAREHPIEELRRERLMLAAERRLLARLTYDLEKLRENP